MWCSEGFHILFTQQLFCGLVTSKMFIYYIKMWNTPQKCHHIPLHYTTLKCCLHFNRVIIMNITALLVFLSGVLLYFLKYSVLSPPQKCIQDHTAKRSGVTLETVVRKQSHHKVHLTACFESAVTSHDLHQPMC